MGWAEFTRGPWRIRAVLVTNVDMYDSDDPSWSAQGDCYLWFVGRMDDDEWFAHGVSDHYDDQTMATDIAASIDGEQMDICLSYYGVEWDDLMTTPTLLEFARLQRDGITHMDPNLYESLRKLTRSEIEALRLAEDRAVQGEHGV